MLSILGTGRFLAPMEQVIRPDIFGCWTEIPDFEYRRSDALALPRGAPSCPAKTRLEIRNDVLIVGDAVIADAVADLIARYALVFPIYICVSHLPVAISIATTQ
jgi:hypothetical protein